MINCNNRTVRESLQHRKRSQKNIHTASIILKPQDSYSDALYLPLRETVNRRIQTHNNHNHNNNTKEQSASTFKKGALQRSIIKFEKSPSLKQQKQNREMMYLGLGGNAGKSQYKFKVFNQSQKRIETDRKSLRKSMEKSMKTIRLRTDYQQNRDCVRETRQLKQKDASASKLNTANQVSTKHTEDSNKIIYISKVELNKLHKLFSKLKQQNTSLKREIQFFGNCQNRSDRNCVESTLLMALHI